MKIWLVPVAAALCLSCGSAPAPPPVPAPSKLFGAEFWKQWGDGQGELSGYDLTIPRYGELRRGVAVTVFVTEPFSASRRVKVDKHDPADPDQFPVLKLNLMEDFQTGMYDYNTMSSAFVALKPVAGLRDGTPAKVSYSSQEWCGQVFHQLAFGPSSIREVLHSYFESEGERDATLDAREDGVSEDVLPFWARQMARPELAPGESRKVPFLGSLQHARLGHKRLAWTEATLTREASQRDIAVPSGRFEVEVWTASVKEGPTLTYLVEKGPPHRIVRWESSDGERAELLAAKRLKYWALNSEKGEAALKELGLSGRPRRTT